VNILVTAPYNFYLGGFTLDTRTTPILYAARAARETKPIYKNEHYLLLEAAVTTTPSQKC
jgi:hypothetical protein